jgi:hypothetical protein
VRPASADDRCREQDGLPSWGSCGSHNAPPIGLWLDFSYRDYLCSPDSDWAASSGELSAIRTVSRKSLAPRS